MPSSRARLREISRLLRRWYAREQRDLPWRHTLDPYRIWISEVMLQQTRVDTVIPYYHRFLDEFPDVESLAVASEDRVLARWAGLGYYSRGRNLHRAAQAVVRDHGGELPDDPDGLRALPGIGEYTAHAIGSIAFGHPRPVLDGNVERVLCRVLALGGDPRRGATRARLRDAVNEALDPRSPGDHNQAVMELGATVCLPRNPACDRCPLARICRARKLGDPARFPTPRPRRAVEEQHWIALVARVGTRVVLLRATAESELLPGQWGLPLARIARTAASRTPRLLDQARALARERLRRTGRDHRAGPAIRHTITHRRLHVHPVHLRLCSDPPVGCRLVEAATSDQLAALHRKVLAVGD